MDEAAIQILLYLYDTVDASFTYPARKRIIGFDYFLRKWKKFNQQQIKEAFNELNRYKLIKKQEYEGSVLVSLSEKGKLSALNAKFRKLSNKKESWDKKWRMVAFDIPNSHRKGRDAIRYRLKNAGFRELQESMFIYPYDCEKEIRDFVRLFKLEKYIRFAIIDFIDDQDNLVKSFKLKANTAFSLE